ncbi:MAG TPA: O-antigen ligase family protein, partial [Ramlibacter sp.]|nr:O-antigen ligase family protein [Ramlibacter sp.]
YTGRTGHLVLLMLALCAAWRAAPRRLRLPVALATLVAGVAIASLSTGVRNRMVESWAEVQAGSSGKPLPRDSRVELLRTGLEVVERQPLLGVGWAQYADTFQEVSARRLGKNAPPIASENPHNEYILQLGAGGVPALVLFVAWLAWPLWRVLRARRRPSPWLGALACVTVAFAIAAIFNSVLHDFVEAHMYSALMAWLLVRRVES